VPRPSRPSAGRPDPVECQAQPRDVGLQQLMGIWRRPIPPQQVDKFIHRYRDVGGQRQAGQYQPAAAAAEWDLDRATAKRERPQQAEPHQAVPLGGGRRQARGLPHHGGIVQRRRVVLVEAERGGQRPQRGRLGLPGAALFEVADGGQAQPGPFGQLPLAEPGPPPVPL
jgi:hypothetical protein